MVDHLRSVTPRSEIILEEEQKIEVPIEHIDIEFSVLNLEIGSKVPSEIKILDILGDSPEEKVFETPFIWS